MLYIHYKEIETPGVPEDPDDEWTNYSDGHIDFEILKVCKERGPNIWLTETVDVDATDWDKAYVVVVRYADGGTFGGTFGYHKFVGVYNNKEEAESRRREIIDNLKEPMDWNKVGYYEEWKNYFASFESCEVFEFELD